MEQLPWWKKDVDEMLAMVCLAAIGILALLKSQTEVAAAAAGAYAVYLGKGKSQS
jgi:hypothetical protein